jgi:5-oxoprolinase (ATP-hydrolysing)
MGRTLQRTSVSVNIRDRLDFSCAIFSPEGSLVANAPHVPVHLGSVSEAVRCQLEYWKDDLADGDVLVSNHPHLAGGSHLPDITVITPVFAVAGGRGRKDIAFWVASRAHHSDIGGIAPGSMPPHSRLLAEEGAAIEAFKLVQAGKFQEAGITELLMAPGKNGVPGSASCRNLADCLSDLRAQVAANHRGISLVRFLIGQYGLPMVHAYMHFIRQTAAYAVSDLLMSFASSKGWKTADEFRHTASGALVSDLNSEEEGRRRMAFGASDFMDDGTPVRLLVIVDEASRRATMDFTGTGPQVFGNTNSPPAITYSAVIYVLRALLDEDIPLNQGCLEPVDIFIPDGSILRPSSEAAVVGGNVLTSQRVVDVLLKAFGAAAASQGCMNNLTLGNERFGYYETIGGGAGAVRGFAGRSGTQVHMTNTRATDVEVFERRYPIVVREFHLRDGSGGSGRWRGGDGIVRSLEFRQPLTASILSERRALAPFGLEGGGCGARGLNLLTRKSNGHVINIGGKISLPVCAGDILTINTPGGGGFGEE